jgi:hypothetical protein
MRGYETFWLGSTEPSDETGIATFTLGDKEVKFKMDNFEQYLDLCNMIDDAVVKTAQRTKSAIFTSIYNHMDKL